MLSVPRIHSLSCLYFVACAFPFVYCSFPSLPLYAFLPCVCFHSLFASHSGIGFLISQVSTLLHACFFSLFIACAPSSACIFPLWYTFSTSQPSASSLLIILTLSFLLLLSLTWAHFPSLMQLFSSLPVLTWKLSLSLVYFPVLSHACELPHVYS